MSPILIRDIYGLKEPGFLIDEVQTPSPDLLAIVRYSSVFWVDYLRNLISEKDSPQCNTLDAVQTFLEKKYLYWLEALSLLWVISEGIIAITQLNDILVSLYHPTPETKTNRDIGTRREQPAYKVYLGCVPVYFGLRGDSNASSSSSIHIGPHLYTNFQSGKEEV